MQEYLPIFLSEILAMCFQSFQLIFIYSKFTQSFFRNFPQWISLVSVLVFHRSSSWDFFKRVFRYFSLFFSWYFARSSSLNFLDIFRTLPWMSFLPKSRFLQQLLWSSSQEFTRIISDISPGIFDKEFRKLFQETFRENLL